MIFQTAILKLTAICNLDCDYCYMFNLSDSTYKLMPKLMSPELASLTVNRIATYLKRKNTQHFTICLHGGEPTLWRFEYFQRFFQAISNENADGLAIDVSLQTNLYKLPSTACLKLFQEHGVRLGISIDGPQFYNDQHRHTSKGLGSYFKIMENIKSLQDQGFQDIIGGFLCVANPDIPPNQFFQWAKSLPVTRLDVLWPIEFNHDTPPWQYTDKIAYLSKPRFGEWFQELFALWWEEDNPNLHIRLFDNLVKIFLVGEGIDHIDFLVNDKLNMFVVNTDGSVEYPDYLRATANGSVKTGMNLTYHELDELHTDPIFAQLLNLRDLLPKDCEPCFYRSVCGGGFLPGRAQAGTRSLLSRERSVMCADQLWFFERVFERVLTRVSSATHLGEFHRAIPLFASIRPNNN